MLQVKLQEVSMVSAHYLAICSWIAWFLADWLPSLHVVISSGMMMSFDLARCKRFRRHKMTGLDPPATF